MATPDYATESQQIVSALQDLYDQVSAGQTTNTVTGGMSNPTLNTTSLSSQLNTAQQSINTLKSTTLSATNEQAWLGAANSTSDSLQDALLQLGNTSISSVASQSVKNLTTALHNAANAATGGLVLGTAALVLLLGLYVAWKVS